MLDTFNQIDIWFGGGFSLNLNEESKLGLNEKSQGQTISMF